jgi:hypothetical protein
MVRVCPPVTFLWDTEMPPAVGHSRSSPIFTEICRCLSLSGVDLSGWFVRYLTIMYLQQMLISVECDETIWVELERMRMRMTEVVVSYFKELPRHSPQSGWLDPCTKFWTMFLRNASQELLHWVHLEGGGWSWVLRCHECMSLSDTLWLVDDTPASCSEWIQSKTSCTISLTSILILSSYLRLGPPNGLILFMFSDNNFVWISHLSHACYMPRLSRPLWFDHLNSILWYVQVLKPLVMDPCPASHQYLPHMFSNSQHPVLIHT